jgi:hypothetical protein
LFNFKYYSSILNFLTKKGKFMQFAKTLFVCLALLVFTSGLFAQADFNPLGSKNLPQGISPLNTEVITATWSALAPSTNALSRSGCVAIVVNDTTHIFQFGGGSGAQATSMIRYNVRTNTWSANAINGAPIPAIPGNLSAASGVAIGDSVIYLFGGEGATVLGRTLKYNVKTNTWTTLANMTTPVTDAAVVKYKDSVVYVIGGGDGLFSPTPTVVRNTVQIYSIRTNSYSSGGTYPITAGMLGAGIYGDTIIAAAGWNGTAAVANSYRGIINPTTLQITWTPIADYPAGAVTRMASYLVRKGTGGGIVFSCGAIGGSTLTGNTYLYDMCTRTWNTLTPNSTPRSNLRGAGLGDSVMYVVAGFTTVGVGNVDKLTFSQIDGSCFAPPTPLVAFNLQTPAAGSRIVTAPGSSTPVTFTWDTATQGINYKLIFGNPTTATRRITLPTGTNSYTTTAGALDAILAANGFTNNGSATDSAVGQWDVWAFKNPGAPGADSLKATNGPRAITLRRQQVVLTPFALTSPASGTSITTSPVNLSPITITWGASGSGSTYRWLFKNAASYSDPAYLRLLSDNGGFGTSLTLRNSQLDSILAAAGMAPGDSTVGTWRVRAYSTTDSLNSTAPDRALTLRRAGLLPLNQSFIDPTFPPLFWTLTFTGTAYWTRQEPGGYGATVGSAMFDYYTASAGTNQSMTTNQFPPVAGPNNYLRFNYAHKFYQPTTTLSADSMAIYTSTNGGTTWNRLITLIATNTPATGYNSTTNMTTTGAIGNNTEYMTPANNEWGTKIFQIPAGTNQVRFTALSAFGNNLFIDDITSGPSTGTGTPLTLTPDKFELKQNYPNPFNPTTKISFSIPKSSFVTLKVYDMLGKEVAQLVNQELTANYYSFDFNGANLASGVYFYKLESASFTDVKRMMLIK